MTLAQFFAVHPLAAALAAAVLGLVVGSFLNVVIVRLPRMMERGWEVQCAELRGEEPAAAPRFDLSRPRSHCPACSHPLAWYENIPVASWLALRGRCAHCGTAIAWRYPAVELLTAALFAACALRFGAAPAALAAAGFCAACVALAFIDAETLLLPDGITLPLLWAGLLANLWGLFAPLADAVIGAMAGYVLLWLVYWGFLLATGREGMGHGDLKLLAAIGAWTGWQALPAVVLLSSLAGVAIGLALVAMRRAALRQALPFGPYLACAGVAALLGGWGWVRWEAM
ncbi:A24 family peptidase [Pigmentiphaga soli]|uniref:Prepilin leader peptidase/N-methyltransferase n=2 Tax=Pigmentiphaga soli TaxID=1007095 RepID=A0ABP8HCE5_9BURK